MSICSVYGVAASLLAASNNNHLRYEFSHRYIVVIQSEKAAEKKRDREGERAQTSKKQPVSESVENKEQSFFANNNKCKWHCQHETMPGYLIDDFQPLQLHRVPPFEQEKKIL